MSLGNSQEAGQRLELTERLEHHLYIKRTENVLWTRQNWTEPLQGNLHLCQLPYWIVFPLDLDWMRIYLQGKLWKTFFIATLDLPEIPLIMLHSLFFWSMLDFNEKLGSLANKIEVSQKPSYFAALCSNLVLVSIESSTVRLSLCSFHLIGKLHSAMLWLNA